MLNTSNKTLVVTFPRSVPTFYKWERAESSGVVGGMAYAAAIGGYTYVARVLCLGGVGAGGQEGSYFRPDVVRADKGAVRVDVVHGCYGTATKPDVESGDFYGVDEALECAACLFFQEFGEALADLLEEGGGDLVMPYFIYHLVDRLLVHSRKAFYGKHVVRAARVQS